MPGRGGSKRKTKKPKEDVPPQKDVNDDGIALLTNNRDSYLQEQIAKYSQDTDSDNRVQILLLNTNFESLHPQLRNEVIRQCPHLLYTSMAGVYTSRLSSTGSLQVGDVDVTWSRSAFPFHLQFTYHWENLRCAHLVSVRQGRSSDPEACAKSLLPQAKAFLAKNIGDEPPHLPFYRITADGGDVCIIGKDHDIIKDRTITKAHEALLKDGPFESWDRATAEAAVSLVNRRRIYAGLLAYLLAPSSSHKEQDASPKIAKAVLPTPKSPSISSVDKEIGDSNKSLKPPTPAQKPHPIPSADENVDLTEISKPLPLGKKPPPISSTKRKKAKIRSLKALPTASKPPSKVSVNKSGDLPIPAGPRSTAPRSPIISAIEENDGPTTCDRPERTQTLQAEKDSTEGGSTSSITVRFEDEHAEETKSQSDSREEPPVPNTTSLSHASEDGKEEIKPESSFHEESHVYDTETLLPAAVDIPTNIHEGEPTEETKPQLALQEQTPVSDTNNLVPASVDGHTTVHEGKPAEEGEPQLGFREETPVSDPHLLSLAPLNADEKDSCKPQSPNELTPNVSKLADVTERDDPTRQEPSIEPSKLEKLVSEIEFIPKGAVPVYAEGPRQIATAIGPALKAGKDAIGVRRHSSPHPIQQDKNQKDSSLSASKGKRPGVDLKARAISKELPGAKRSRQRSATSTFQDSPEPSPKERETHRETTLKENNSLRDLPDDALAKVAFAIKADKIEIIYNQHLLCGYHPSEPFAQSPRPRTYLEQARSAPSSWSYATGTDRDKQLASDGIWLWEKAATYLWPQAPIVADGHDDLRPAHVRISKMHTGCTEPAVIFDKGVIEIIPHENPWKDARSCITHPDFLPPVKLAEYQACEAAGYKVWRFDREPLYCSYSGCGIRLLDTDSPTIVCPGCGPFTWTRYCSWSHQMQDIDKHWRECGQSHLTIMTVVDQASLPRRFTTLLPMIPEKNSVRSPAMLRQKLAAITKFGHYTIYDRVGQVSAVLHWPTSQNFHSYRKMNLRIERCLNLAFFDTENHRVIDYLFRLLCALVFQCTSIDRTSCIERLEIQFALEFRRDVSFIDPTSLCECQWRGKNFGRRSNHAWGCPWRLFSQELLEKVLGDGVEGTLDRYESQYWILRAWQQQHPDEKDWKRRARGICFKGDLKGTDDHRLGEGFEGWGAPPNNLLV